VVIFTDCRPEARRLRSVREYGANGPAINRKDHCGLGERAMEDVVRTITVVVIFAFVFLIGESWARKLVGPTEAAKSAMTGNTSLEKRLSDLERRHNKTREFLINYMSLTTSLLVGFLVSFYSKIEGDIVFMIVLGGAYAVTNLVSRWVLEA